MKHLFAPYELALLAKEKGFRENCFAHWQTGTMDFKFFASIDGLDVNNTGFVSAPLYQQLVDWFREKHGIYIVVDNSILSHKYQVHGRLAWQIKNNSAAGTYYEALTTALTESFKFI